MNRLLIIVLFVFCININLYSQTDRVFHDNIFSDSFGNSVYEFSRGKYNILQYNANIREEPSIKSNIVAVMNLNDEIEILENSGKSEKINNVWAYWYKIKYGNVIGYTFGGNIAVQTLVYNNIFCYYRVSNMIKHPYDKNNFDNYEYQNNISPNDIFIYINKIKISNEVIVNFNKNNNYNEGWYSCRFAKIHDNPIFIFLNGYSTDVFKINNKNEIEFSSSRS